MIKRIKITPYMLLLTLLSCMVLISCPSEENGNDTTYAVTLRFINIDALGGTGAHDGQTLLAMLSTAADCLSSPVGWGSTVISGDTGILVLPTIPEGTYIGCGFIDVNGNAAGDLTSEPDTGDYIGDSGGMNIEVTGDMDVDIDTSTWIVYVTE